MKLVTQDFEDIKEEMVQGYVDNYSALDDNVEVQEWLKDSYPEVNVKINNKKMNRSISANDIMYNSDNSILNITNEDDLQDKTFYFDGSQWLSAC